MIILVTMGKRKRLTFVVGNGFRMVKVQRVRNNRFVFLATLRILYTRCKQREHSY